MSLPEGLYALVDDSLLPSSALRSHAEQVLQGGARVVQLRLKRTPDAAALELVRAVVAVARPLGAVVIVNDRADLALLGDAGGVHLGADDVTPELARRVLGQGRLVGATVRSLEDIVAAKAQGADYVGLGPVFSTATKQVGVPALGVEAFEKIVRASPLPVVGIAGITLETIAAVARSGAHGAAVASDLLKGSDVVSRARALQQAFSQAR